MDAFAAALRGAPVRAAAGATAVGAGAVAAAADPDDGGTRVLTAAPTRDEPATAARWPVPPPGLAAVGGGRARRTPAGAADRVARSRRRGRDPVAGGQRRHRERVRAAAETPTRESPSAEEPTSEAPSPEEPAGVEVVAEDYIGMHKDEAKARLEALGLKVKEQKVDNDGSVEQDTVTDVVPVGTLQEGDEVTHLRRRQAPARAASGAHRDAAGRDRGAARPGRGATRTEQRQAGLGTED